jgi:NADH:ubiquinone oxidoreductase subunit 4 (subunit M)
MVAAAMLNWIRHALWGEQVLGGSPGDLLPEERQALLLLGMLVLIFGLLPSLLLDYINPVNLLDRL